MALSITKYNCVELSVSKVVGFGRLYLVNLQRSVNSTVVVFS